MDERIELGAFDTRKGAEEGTEITLRAPSGAELTGFMVRGHDSPTYQAALEEYQSKLLEQARWRNVSTPEERKQELRRELIELVALLVIGWPDRLSLEGEPFPFSRKNAAIFLQRFPWAREQIEGVARERANFLPKSSSGSSPTPGTSGA